MAAWELALQLPTGDLPLFRRIANAIETDIARGRLQAGAKLLSSRALATQLGVSRNTVVTAYEELGMRGGIGIEPTRGAFIVGAPRADSTPAGAASEPYPRSAGFDLAATPPISLPAP